MKRSFLFTVIIFVLGGIFSSCDFSNVNFKEKKLPNRAHSFVRNNFPENKVDSIFISIDRFYTARLDNGVEVDFNSKGEWVDVWFNKMDPSQTFLSSLPQQMIEYVKENYPDSRIKGIEKNNYFSRNFTYSIYLSKLKTKQLSFDKNGNVLISKLSEKDLPRIANSLISKYFQEDSVIYIDQSKNRSYHVFLESGTQIDFDRKGNWSEMSSKKKGLPESVLSILPKQAKEYLNKGKTNEKILRIEKKSYGYRVHLGQPNDRYVSFSRTGAVVEGDILDN